MSASLRSFWLPAVVVLAAVGGVATLAVQGQVDARQDLEDRFAARAEVAGALVHAHIEDVFARQAVAVERHLTGPAPTAEDVADVAVVQGADVAILVDDEAVIIGGYIDGDPPEHGIVGYDLSGMYSPLDRAVEHGERTVSGIVEIADSPPFVSFNLPFETPSGRRVYAAGFYPEATLLSPFLGDLAASGGHDAYLVDDAGLIVASSNGAMDELVAHDPDLAASVADVDGADAGDAGSGHQYTASRVEGTPWTLALKVSNDELYGPLRNVRRATSIVLVSLAIGTLWILGLLVVARSRAGQLARIAVTDPLTGTGNRRTLDAWARHVDPNTPIAAMVVDLDTFKQINDTCGHQVGDEVLLTVGRRLRLAVRAGDEVVRWGGDEFAVVLQNADAVIADESAERVRASVEEPITTSAGPMRVTASVGVAIGRAGALARALGRADVALYEAKRSGRNRAVVVGPEPDQLTA